MVSLINMVLLIVLIGVVAIFGIFKIGAFIFSKCQISTVSTTWSKLLEKIMVEGTVHDVFDTYIIMNYKFRQYKIVYSFVDKINLCVLQSIDGHDMGINPSAKIDPSEKFIKFAIKEYDKKVQRILEE